MALLCKQEVTGSIPVGSTYRSTCKCGGFGSPSLSRRSASRIEKRRRCPTAAQAESRGGPPAEIEQPSSWPWRPISEKHPILHLKSKHAWDLYLHQDLRDRSRSGRFGLPGRWPDPATRESQAGGCRGGGVSRSLARPALRTTRFLRHAMRRQRPPAALASDHSSTMALVARDMG
jgi:hypothetical protein